MRSLKHTFIKNIGWNASVNISINLLQLVQLAFLTRLLKPSDFGLMALVMVFAALVQVVQDMGIGNALIYKQNSTIYQISTIYWLNVLIGVSLFSVGYLFSPWISAFFNEEELTYLIKVFSIVFFIQSLGKPFKSLLERDFSFKYIAKVEISASITATITTIYFAFLYHSVLALVYGQIVKNLVLNCGYIFKGITKWKIKLHFNINEIKEYIRFGVYQMGERIVYFISRNVDKVIIGHSLGSEVLGYYNIAYQLMMRPYQAFNPIITRVLYPTLSKIQSDLSKVKKIYIKVVDTIIVIMWPVYMVLILYSTQLLKLYLGDGWELSNQLFRLLSILAFFYIQGNPISSLVLSQGKPEISFWFNIVGTLGYIIAIYIGSMFDIFGIVYALILAQTFVNFPVSFYVRWRVVRMSVKEYIVVFINGFIVISVIGGVSLILKQIFYPDNYIYLSINIFIEIVVFLLLFYLLKKDEIKTLLLNNS